jgi:DNA-binding transcriptional LysR family regulator
LNRIDTQGPTENTAGTAIRVVIQADAIEAIVVLLGAGTGNRHLRAISAIHVLRSMGLDRYNELEGELGERLFDRSSRDGLLTDAGRTLQGYAERLLNLRHDACTALGELKELQRGKLAIAANELTALYLLPVLAEFRSLHPMIRIAVQRSLGSAMPDDVLRHNAELGVLTYNPQEPRLCSTVVYLDELVFVVPPAHPLAKAHQVSIRQLGAESFVAHNVPSPYREKVIGAFKRHKTPLHMDIELPTLQAIKCFVAMGNGVALLPEICVENEVARAELIRIPVRELRLHRKLRLIYRKSASLSNAARAFLKVVEAMARERRGRYRFQREH